MLGKRVFVEDARCDNELENTRECEGALHTLYAFTMASNLYGRCVVHGVFGKYYGVV